MTCYIVLRCQMVRRKQAGGSSERNHVQTNKKADHSKSVGLKPFDGFNTNTNQSRRILSWGSTWPSSTTSSNSNQLQHTPSCGFNWSELKSTAPVWNRDRIILRWDWNQNQNHQNPFLTYEQQRNITNIQVLVCGRCLVPNCPEKVPSSPFRTSVCSTHWPKPTAA